MKPYSRNRLFNRPSRKREAGQTATEYAIVLSSITIGVMAAFVILSGGVLNAIERVVGLYPG